MRDGLTQSAQWPLYVDTHVDQTWEIRCAECHGAIIASHTFEAGARLTAVLLVNATTRHVADAHPEG